MSLIKSLIQICLLANLQMAKERKNAWLINTILTALLLIAAKPRS